MLIPNAFRYIGAVFGISLIGSGALMAGFEVGGLVFAVSPLVAAVIVRAIGGDGLRGIGLGWTGKQGWYWLAIVVFPVAMSVSVGIGLLAGAVELGEGISVASIGAATLTGLIPRLAIAIGEEFGWRGYLTPLLHANRVHPIANHAIVGVTWTLWHVPFIVATPTDIEQPVWLFAPLFACGVTGMAFILGETRLRTRSVWPAVYAHGIGNALGYALLGEGVFVRIDVLWFAPRPEGIVMIVVLGLVAIAIALLPRPATRPPVSDILPPFLFMP